MREADTSVLTELGDVAVAMLPSGWVSSTGAVPAGVFALAALALQLNGQIRHARIAARDRRLVAEAFLRAELVTSAWIGETARAVAAAAAHCQARVTLVTTDHRVAESYLATTTTETQTLTRIES